MKIENKNILIYKEVIFILSKDVTGKLKESGYKLTRQRRAIIEVLLSNEQLMTAMELLKKVKKVSPTVSHDTLYRNLELLSSINVVNRIPARGGDLFELNRHHHHHFVCVSCNEVTCLKNCPIGPEHLAEACENGFEVLYHNFVLSGYCIKCQNSKRGTKKDD